MTMFQRRRHEVPGLNTASLPDLIFTVLFFFMIVTHMQKVAVKVQFRTPQGTNDKFTPAAEVADYVTAERNRMSPEDQEQMTVSIKADRGTHMGIISDVKQALREAKAYRINYSAAEKKKR